jgi:hypothetical protein
MSREVRAAWRTIFWAALMVIYVPANAFVMWMDEHRADRNEDGSLEQPGYQLEGLNRPVDSAGPTGLPTLIDQNLQRLGHTGDVRVPFVRRTVRPHAAECFIADVHELLVPVADYREPHAITVAFRRRDVHQVFAHG